MKPFRHILSLGSACQATVQLRANFPTLKAGPFDWWVTPFERMVAFLDATDWSLFEAGDLEPVQNRVSIASRRHGFIFQHDFQRDAEGLVDMGRVEQQLPALREKYAARLERMDRQVRSGEPVLFLRWRRDHFMDWTRPPDDAPSTAGLDDLCQMVRRRWPQSDATFLFVNYDRRCDDPSAMFGHADSSQAADWTGDAEAWRALFESHDVTLAD